MAVCSEIHKQSIRIRVSRKWKVWTLETGGAQVNYWDFKMVKNHKWSTKNICIVLD